MSVRCTSPVPRNIDYEVVKLAPLPRYAKKLRDVLWQAWARAIDGLVARIQQTHRNPFHALRLHGMNVLVGGRAGLLRVSRQDRDVRATLVVAQTDLCEFLPARARD